MTQRYLRLFNTCHNQSRIALIPFFVLGYPDIETSLQFIFASIDAGVDGLELGLPFSDPIADGPIIQAATHEALTQGMNFDIALTMIHQIRQRCSTIPIGILGYTNAVETYQEYFYQSLSEVGADSILLADLPTQSLPIYAKKANRFRLHAIGMATPSCHLNDLKKISNFGSAYTYVVTRKGVTGEGVKGQFESAEQLQQTLSHLNAPPAVFGFGIQSAEDIRLAKLGGAQGVIIGTHLIRHYYQNPSVKALYDKFKTLKIAT
jgi:tryptophan synthase alpha chain